MKLEDMTEEWLWKEIEKIKYTYKLNEVIRYDQKRIEKKENQTQSVSEHVYSMLILAQYFRDLEDPEHKLDMEKVTRIILMHDMDEIVTGDYMTNVKTETHEQEAKDALQVVFENSPDFVKKELMAFNEEYENLSTPEALYVKALDKIETSFWWGVVCQDNMLTLVNTHQDRENNEAKRRKIYEKGGFKVIAKFGELIYEDHAKKELATRLKLRNSIMS